MHHGYFQPTQSNSTVLIDLRLQIPVFHFHSVDSMEHDSNVQHHSFSYMIRYHNILFTVLYNKTINISIPILTYIIPYISYPILSYYSFNSKTLHLSTVHLHIHLSLSLSLPFPIIMRFS